MEVCLKNSSMKDQPMQRRAQIFTRWIAGACCLATMTGCQTAEPAGGPLIADVQGENAVSTLQRINDRALNCWIKSGDTAFEDYALVPELDSRANDPRILIVSRGKAQGLPQMVITASGEPVRLSTFGPLTNQSISNRINADISAWSEGATGCGSRS